MLECQSVTRRFASFTAVDSVSFRVEPGEIVGLLGHNGAGKTTIMRMITGALEPSSGQVTLDGLDMQRHSLELHARIGYLPEQLPLYPEMTIVEYLDYCAGLRGIDNRRERKEAVQRVVYDTQLEDKLTSPIQTLSRGYKQRVGVAQALLNNPKLLVLDEPTNGLDPEQTRHMRDLIRRLGQSATVILSTHIMQEVNAVCDRVLMLQQGRLTLDEPIAELADRAVLHVQCGDPKRALERIESMAGIDRTTLTDTGLRLALAHTADRRQLAAQVSRTLVNDGIDLYQIAGEQRDLEQLFFEATDTEPRAAQPKKEAATDVA
ncbi:ABC transporter ATP-binding protein [Saccharospirillum salsuginis]|uniref:ABC transporter domain-containing protein n=1 Tax=Saccharospirillum salsuginis TaxID=418750 RepID=A0A918KTV4_9GAMM|nr:ABC transporter ATP-binding protein [Saccharospirillum salsuginis]GGX73290.1 hypothetical protein GCM10007392_45880 [Saccharospirillum salsuginis]